MRDRAGRTEIAAINFKELLRRVDHDRELLQELFDILRTDLPRLLNELRTAISTGNTISAGAHAHTLKGLLVSLAAGQAAASAARIEELAKQGNGAQAAGILESFAAEAQAVIPELASYLEETA